MAVSDAKRASNARWDAEHMAYQTVKVNKSLLDNFKATCAARGDRVNTVLRKAMEDYVGDTEKVEQDSEAKRKTKEKEEV